MRPFKVVITDREYEQIDQEKRILQAAGAEVFDYQYKDEADILKVAADCDALIVQYAKVPASLISGLKRCKIIARYATGVDGIDLKAAGERGIYVTNVRDYCTEEVSTHALALILELSQKTAKYSRWIKEGQWNYRKGLPCAGLKEKVVGLIGYGKIARACARKLKPLCDQIWIDSKHASAEELKKEGLVLKSREAILANADFISLHAPLTKENYHMFNKSTFEKMKKEACLINVARGSLVCEEDLFRALREGQIAGAALDVMEKEPPNRDNPLLTFDNVILTPHIAWYSQAAQERLQSAVAKEVARVLTGSKPENCVNSEFLSKNAAGMV